jgi:hypothetical protein
LGALRLAIKAVLANPNDTEAVRWLWALAICVTEYNDELPEVA